jgi:hypothetical protein
MYLFVFFAFAYSLAFLVVEGSVYDECPKCLCTAKKAEAAAAFRSGHGFLYFQHIHKAGGSTLCSILSRSNHVRFGRHVNCNLKVETIPGNTSSEVTMRSVPFDWSLSDAENFLKSTKRNAMAGEDQPMAPFWGLQQFEPEKHNLWSFVTIVRHPVERLISHFKFE